MVVIYASIACGRNSQALGTALSVYNAVIDMSSAESLLGWTGAVLLGASPANVSPGNSS